MILMIRNRNTNRFFGSRFLNDEQKGYIVSRLPSVRTSTLSLKESMDKAKHDMEGKEHKYYSVVKTSK